MSTDVWMAVSSTSLRDDELRVGYQDNIDKVYVQIGSGTLYMSVAVAEELFDKLRAALKDGALAQAVASGSGLWLTATDFIPSETVSDLRDEAAVA